MISETSFSQTRPLARSRGPHDVELYTDDEGLAASVADFLGAGLRAGEPLIVIATPEHVEAVTRLLRQSYVDVDRARSAGMLSIFDARETLASFMAGGLPDPQRFRSLLSSILAGIEARCGSSCIRAYGEMVDVLWREGERQAAIQLEALWNELASAHLFTLRCAYRIGGFVKQGASSMDLHRVCEAHRHVIHTFPVENHFRLLVESVKDHAIFLLDRDGRIASWNPGAERLKGYRAAEIISEAFSRFYPEEDVRAGKCERLLQAALRDGRVEDEGWRVRKDGTRFWANVIITAIHDREGRHLGFSKVTRDLTERRNAAEELIREQVARARAEGARQEAEEAARLGEMFVGMLGHDLRNPLSAVSTGAQVILRTAADERIRKSAARIITSSERMTRMIDQLLDFTRIRLSGGLALQPASVNLGELARQIIEETEAAHVCSIRLERLGDTGGAWDGDRLAQLLSNLLANAVQHGTPGVPIGVRVDGRGDGEVVLEARNRGRIPAEVLPHLFKPFRGTRRHQSPARGLGLGLFIAHEIVRAHGGAMAVSSDEEGTTFSVRLPRRPSALLSAPPAP